MRADMAKVIVERPRIGYRPTRRGRSQEFDDMPAREGVRRRHVLLGDPKILNENLAPLRRYLARQVGRPWDKIYAEICVNLRADNTVQQHVRDHLRDFVAIKPRRWVGGSRNSSLTGLWWQEFYVDPRTGLLCRTDRLPEEKARRRARLDRPTTPADYIALAHDRELRLIAGIWYEIALQPLPQPVYRASHETLRRPLKPWMRASPFVEVEMEVRRLSSGPVRDVISGRLLALGPTVDEPAAWEMYRRNHSDRRYAVAKRVLSRRELRCHRLQNTA